MLAHLFHCVKMEAFALVRILRRTDQIRQPHYFAEARVLVLSSSLVSHPPTVTLSQSKDDC
ncbi:MAG: hypothetical protein AMJ88_08595 [Anaerolineae bacterium SM23_ 63]|nr:MAG: hypothetical protein AMJ88_08595 [Anaerolineae bacterium SM23_ 63]